MSPGGKTTRMILATLAVVGLFGVSGITASNTVPSTSEAGIGSVAVSGYKVDSLHYTLDSTSPTEMTAVSVQIDKNIDKNASAKIQLTSGGTWYDCTIGAFDTATKKSTLSCATTAGAVLDANNATVVIAE